MELKRIDPGSSARVLGILYGLLGLIFGGIFSLITLLGAVFGGGSEGAVGGLLVGAGAVLIFPIFYGVIGAIFAALGAVLYNLVAGRVGGLQLDLE